MSDPTFTGALPASLLEALRSSSSPVSLALHRHHRNHELEARLAASARWIEEGSGGLVAVTEGSGSGPPGVPALTLRSGERDVIHYMASPEGPEQPPFLDAVAALARPPDPDATIRPLESLEQPLEILVFVAPQCPNCPHTVRAATRAAAFSPRITVSIVDVTRFAEHAAFFDVRSVPTVVLDGEVIAVGVVSFSRLVKLLLHRADPQGERLVLASLVEAGHFTDAARRISDTRGARAFADIWGSSSLQERIGLVLTADQALESSPRALDDLVPLLLPALESSDPARRGDTADLLGRIGHPVAQPALEILRHDTHPDVAEAAGDALERIAMLLQEGPARHRGGD